MAEEKTLYFVFYLIAGIFVILMLSKMGIDWGSGKAIQRDYLAYDVAMIMDAAYAVPGNVEINYVIQGYRSDIISRTADYLKGGKSGYNLSLQNYEVKTIPQLGKESYSEFIRDDKMAFDNQTVAVFTDFDMPLSIRKNSNAILINKYSEEVGKFLIPKVETKNPFWAQSEIILDGDKKTLSIIDSIKVSLGTNVKLINDEALDKDELLNSQKKAEKYGSADIMLAIYYGDPSLNSTYIFANSNPKSEKLAKMILSEMITQSTDVPKFSKAAYSPKIEKGIASENRIDIIDTQSTGVFIEMNMKELNVVERKKLANIISQMIINYYTK